MTPPRSALGAGRLLPLLLAGLIVLLAGRDGRAATDTRPQTTVERPTDYDVIANYLAAFCRYVTWPGTTGTPAEAPLRIGVVGPNPFGPSLDRVLAAKTHNGRQLVAVYAATPEQATGCQLVFVSSNRDNERATTLRFFADQPVLTVVYLGGDSGGSPTGASIELIRTGNNIRYLLNPAALSAQQLQATPGLLENAQRRIGGGKP